MWIAIHSMRSPVPGCPKNSPRCVPPKRSTSTTLSPSATTSSTSARASEIASCGLCGHRYDRFVLLCELRAHRESTAEASRSATQRKQFDGIRKWNPSELPDWLNEKAYRRESLPRLSKFTVKAICLALDVSHPYATNIRRGTVLPQRRRPKVSSRR